MHTVHCTVIYQVVYFKDHQLIFKILHALGLLHEHQRPDRDEHIVVDMISLKKFGLDKHFKKACFLQFQIIFTQVCLHNEMKEKTCKSLIGNQRML